ncbi:acylphosphatase-2-like isoform X1 [Chrysemys picta bellii]|uniref:acylphosphatase-2-like isoform X1 n=1 Tax=Chrysemys picta bellii TaxID=8478 RepID=UPI000CE646BE|nr:acylphosphatase-2-like isoform X1 [Chrysemys picta bellii]XP_023956052.1 acylphosphatase-2-like isoform X1 [Chrysemys picta bellii]
MASSGLWALDYEVYGDVQGVFFRKYTEDQGKKLGVVGWVKNTPYGTVTGQVQGPKEKIEIMGRRNLLAHPPSPVAAGKGRRGNFRSNGSVTFRDMTTRGSFHSNKSPFHHLQHLETEREVEQFP